MAAVSDAPLADPLVGAIVAFLSDGRLSSLRTLATQWMLADNDIFTAHGHRMRCDALWHWYVTLATDGNSFKVRLSLVARAGGLDALAADLRVIYAATLLGVPLDE